MKDGSRGLPTLGYYRPRPLPDHDPALSELALLIWAVVGVSVLGLALAASGSVIQGP